MRRRDGLTLVELIVVITVLVAVAVIVVPLLTGITTESQYTTTKASMTTLRNAVLQYYQDMKGIPLPRPAQGLTTGNDSTGMPQFLKELQLPPTDASGATITVDANGNSIRFNPTTKRGWRGPYLQQATGTFLFTNANGSTHLHSKFSSYGNVGDIAFYDGWGNPIVLQWPSVGEGLNWNAAQDDLTTRVQNVRLVSAGAPSDHGLSVLDTVRLGGASLKCMPTRTAPDLRGNDLLLFILAQDLYPWTPSN